MSSELISFEDWRKLDGKSNRKADYVAEMSETERKAALLGCIWTVPMSEALSAAGVRRATYIRWLREDPEFKEAIKEAKELQVDEVEVAAFRNAKQGDGATQRFILQSRRSHEYPPVSKIELTGKDGGPVQQRVQIEFVDPDEGAVSTEAKPAI